ncbi:MAG: peptidyl-prolyl cis-trans isomerase [Methylacidiphilales bacterium]|nr:peptidyl-prolyl cis-trans isomerase [Candidatus Methylacidiphilales bacterium]
MMRFLRSQSQTVLVVILAILGLSFMFYGNVGNLLTSSGNRGPSDFGSIEGENLTGSDLFDAIHNVRYTLILQGRQQELNQEGIGPQIAAEAWRQLLLQHEADKLHINITDQELLDYIHHAPLFQDPKTGAYSPDIYKDRIAQLQGIFRIPSDSGADPLATTRAVVENILRQMIRSRVTRNALLSTIRAPAGDVSEAYEKSYGPATVSMVTFDPKAFLASTQVTPDEIAAEYKNHPQNPAYRTKEKRKVDYVIFPLTPDQAKLPDKDKNAALDVLGQKALEFVLAFQPDPSLNPAGATPPDFVTEAKKQGLTPVTTDFFTVDTPPAGLPPSPAFNNAAFDLSKDDPVSKVIELSDGVAVIHLDEIEPSDLRPLDEVKAAIQQQLQQAKVIAAANAASKDAAQALQAVVDKGADFKTAVAALNLKVVTLPPFVPAKVNDSDPRLQTIAYVTHELEVGQISPPIPMENDNTIVILHLDSRGKADPSGLADFEVSYHDSRDRELQTQVYLDWANWMDKRPGTHKPPNLDQYGSIE